MARALSSSLLLAAALASASCTDATAPRVDAAKYDLLFESMSAPAENQSQLFVLASGATSAARLFSDGVVASQPRVSADGRWVAYIAPSVANGDDAIWLARTDASERRQVFTSPGSVILRPAPSPDGSRVAFQASDDQLQSSGIWLVNADGTNAHAVTAPAHDVVHTAPSWSPDGGRIALAFGPSGHLRVATMSADGGPLTAVTEPASGSDTEPYWSPDGSQLVIVHSATPAQADLEVVTLATGQRRILYAGNGRHPAWSPAGDVIAFSARLGQDPNELFVIPAGGGVAQRLTSNEVPDRHPNWVRRTP